MEWAMTELLRHPTLLKKLQTEKFDWELPEGTKGKDLDTTEQPGVSLNRKHPLLAVATHG
ncbi:hypothetical protein ACS0TY_035747 [Phlomoides rotata]